MWITLLVMAAAVSLEPFRIGMSVLMLNRPRPHLQLAAFLCGGFLMGLSVGAVVLFAVDSRLLASAHFTLPRVQIVIGVLALLAAHPAAAAARDQHGNLPLAWALSTGAPTEVVAAILAAHPPAACEVSASPPSAGIP